ncbi:hypothetical protein Trydic_g3079 [Trypoxylus dichotomus]
MFSFFAAEGKKDHCNKTVEVYEDVSSPEVTPENVGKPMTCWYRFRSFRGSPKDWILRIKFNKFKVGTLLNASHCDGGYMQVSGFVVRRLPPVRPVFTGFYCDRFHREFVLERAEEVSRVKTDEL